MQKTVFNRSSGLNAIEDPKDNIKQTMKPGPDLPMVISRPHYISGRDCGYCNGKKEDYHALESQKTTNGDKESQSITIGCQVEQMTCQHYDELINQGFRRSGTFLYKPDLLRGCCRLFTIRTDVTQLKVTKAHRKTINRFIRAISDEPDTKEGNKHFDLYSLVKAEQKSTRFHTKYEPSKFSKEKFELYKKYQVHIHNDEPSDVTERSFKRFLCDTPFPEKEVMGSLADWETLNHWVKRWLPEDNTPSNRVGPTHECYYLDGKLIAISILDFLPTGVSSIYFIWDPDYAHLSLGTLSGLREIIMCSELQLGYYYLGYYIEDCAKMNYKLKFGGELLDLCNEVYFPLPAVGEFIKNGRFFVVGDANDSDETAYANELELENTGHPTAVSGSEFDNKSLVDVSEKIYANNSIYDDANKALAILQKSYGIGSASDSVYKLPAVVPGIIPIWQILEWFHSGAIDNDLPVSIFTMMTADLKECDFGQLNPIGKSIVVDCIRLFGLEKFQDCIILV